MIHSGRLETSIVEGYLTRMINEVKQRLTDNTVCTVSPKNVREELKPYNRKRIR